MHRPQIAPPLEITLQPHVHGARIPRLDPRVVHTDLIAGGRRITRIRQINTARVLDEIGPTDRMIIRGPGDQILLEIVARIETREEPQILFFRAGAPVDERQLRDPQRVSGRHNQEGLSGGIAENLAARSALIVAGGVAERAFTLRVRLLGPHSAHQLQSIL